MKQERGLAGLVLLAIFVCGSASAKNCHAEPDRCAMRSAVNSSVPLRIYRNFVVVVEGQIGGRPLNFVVDTGTSPSIVDARVVKELDIPTTAAELEVIGNVIESHAATLPDLELGPIAATSIPVQVQDLSPMERALGVPVAGILGLDVLSHANFRLDYVGKRLEFGDIAEDGIRALLDPRRGLAVVDARVEGKPARMLVDTGTDRVALFGQSFRGMRALSARETTQKGSNVFEQVIGVRVVVAPEIAVGAQHFTVERAYLVPGSADPSFDGLFGVRALGFRAIAYNQMRRAVYLQK